MDDEGKGLGEHAQEFTLNNDYKVYKHATVEAPVGAATCYLSYRLLGGTARWPTEEVVIMIDAIKLFKEVEPEEGENLFKNGDFETVDGFSDWRAIEVFQDQTTGAISVANMDSDETATGISYSDNAKSGDHAAEIAWVFPYRDDYIDALFDQQIDVTPGDKLVFEASAMNVDGPAMVLQMRAQFYKIGWQTMLDSAHNEWVLEQSTEYSTHKVEYIVPEGTDFCLIGFRPMAADGSGPLEENTTTLIDDVKLNVVVPEEENFFKDGGFEDPNDFADWRTVEVYFADDGGVSVGNFSEETVLSNANYSDNANTGNHAAEIFWSGQYRDDYQDALMDQMIYLADNGINPGDTLIFEASAMNVNGPTMGLQLRASFYANGWGNGVDMQDNDWILEQSAST